ncbi:MAG: NAD(P)-binding domain-containing protein [Nitrospinae bacterium]|nr:NAD(P)-binding domain-containing protein [Nitrospinota bacterium]
MFDIIIIGAGASGLSAALAAHEQGLSYLVLEQRTLANTVANMPKRKRIFSTPMKMPQRGRLWFSDATREELLEKWSEVVQEYGLHVKENEGVAEITPLDDGFQVRSEKETYHAKRLILSIGTQGNPRKMGVPGEEDSTKVFYQLSDPDEFVDRGILVVGGGDSAVEAALALCDRNRVTISYRRGEFVRLKQRNAMAIEEKIREGRVTVYFNSQVIRIDAQQVELACPDGAKRLPNDSVFALIGTEPPYGFLEKLGVAFKEDEGQKVPQLNERFETSVPGLHLVGSVAGRPLMKRAINQGHDVIQHIARDLRGTAAGAVGPSKEALRERLASVQVNLETCTGCGVCEAACPPVFKVVQDKSTVDDSQVDAYLPHCLVAEKYCPTKSIRVTQLKPEAKEAKAGPWESLRNLWRRTKVAPAAGQGAPSSGNGERLQVTAVAFNGRSMADIAALVNQIPFFSSLTPAELLKQIPLFSELSEDALGEVATGSTLRYFPANTPIIREGDYGETFFVILSGSVHVVATTAEGLKLFLATMGQHDFFGEMAALTGFPRSTTITATTDTIVLEIEKHVLIDLMDESKMVKGAVSQAYTDRTLHTLFGRVPLFTGLNKTSLGLLMSKVKLRTFSSGAVIIRERDPGDSLYVIRNGTVKISTWMGDRERVLAYLRDGTCFGEMALIRNEPRNATITALTKVEVAQMMRDDFHALLREHPEILSKVQETIRQREGERAELLAHPEWLDRQEILQEVVHTTDVLVIDLETCIHCDNCVRGCEEIHPDGVSRLIREGIKIDHYLVATSCRNCEDPLCMTECPVSAIARDENGEVYIKDHCVSCGACVRNCPYGNINLYDPKVHAKGKNTGGELWSKFMGLLGAESPPTEEVHKPVKCDLCRDFSTPNCVRSCPTGAAMRINPQVFFKVKS